MFTIIVVLLSAMICSAHPFGSIIATATQPAPIEIADGCPATNCVIAQFQVTANGDPFGDSAGFQLTQLAFSVSATGSWIYHQVLNLRLLDDQGNTISGPESVWSNPIVCDCDGGRVIFDNIANFTVYTNTPRILTLIADVAGSFMVDSYVSVSYNHGDSRIVDLYSGVNETLQPATVGASMIKIATPISMTYPVRIDTIRYQTSEHDTNMVILNMFGKIEPNTAYKVEVSPDLVTWTECGEIAATDSTVLKEPAVGLIDSRIYGEKAFFRLRKSPSSRTN